MKPRIGLVAHGLSEHDLGGTLNCSASERCSEALLHENPLRVGRRGPPFSSPQEPHYRDEVEGPSHAIRRSTALRTGRPTIRPSFDAAM